MELDPAVLHEWRCDHHLCPATLRWITTHAEPGDLHPIFTTIAALWADVASRDALRP